MSTPVFGAGCIIDKCGQLDTGITAYALSSRKNCNQPF